MKRSHCILRSKQEEVTVKAMESMSVQAIIEARIMTKSVQNNQSHRGNF